MPIDYSKWDKLELSDDEDFECHPNVDKASFIRWKQADIHQKREERRQKIQALKQEYEQNEVLIGHINQIINTIESEGVGAFLKTVEELRQKNANLRSEQEEKQKELRESNPSPENHPPTIPPTFEEMMTVLLEKIQNEVKSQSEELVGDSLIIKLKEHHKKLESRQKEVQNEMEKEEDEAKKKITMDDLHDGFNKTAVSKVNKPELPKSKRNTEKVVEVLNPGAEMKPIEGYQSKESSSINGHKDDDEEAITSDVAKEFAKIKDYEGSYRFISSHPEIVDQEIVDQILAEAFQAQMKGKAKYAKQCVHQAWLLQYCQQLGKDGVRLFFQRITSPQAQQQARQIFNTDVEETYKRITERCKTIEEERKQSSSGKQAEQIQIEIVGKNDSLTIQIPTADSTDPEEKARYEIYMTLSQDLREAFETEELEKINLVLGKMSVDEAEKALEIINKAGVLTIEEGIIDATKGETIESRQAEVKKPSETEDA
ncbi:hypothetical protein G9A89_004393 [Geosiphon pyriformis]|nr:hypothetical protein G9A89_004393 [Geosiphon pyriformis]